MSLAVVRALGLCTVQDLGRPGHMHQALAPGGALVPGLLVAANRAADNPDHCAAIEVLGELVVIAEAPVTIATDRVARRTLQIGEELALASAPRRATYLALRGGVAAPLILGSRATQRSAGLGTLLRKRDLLHVGDAPVTRGEPAINALDGGAIELVPGPDLAAFPPDALENLCSGAYRISPTSDRVGTRLDGPAIARRTGSHPSGPMVRGAIEITGGGQPIVLGPEHPTTGGYPLIGVVATRHLDRLFALPAGGALTFRVVGHATPSSASSS